MLFPTLLPPGVVVGGVPITLLDTAGLRESADLVEQIGVERSVAAARQADIVLVVLDAQVGWTQGDAEIAEQLFGESAGASSTGNGSSGGSGGRRGAPALLVLNKSDLAQRVQQDAAQQAQQDGSQQGSNGGPAGEPAHAGSPSAAALGVPPAVAARFAEVVGTSAATREGLEELQAAVLRLAGAPQVGPQRAAAPQLPPPPPQLPCWSPCCVFPTWCRPACPSRPSAVLCLALALH